MNVPADRDLLPWPGTSVRLRDVTLADADLLDGWNREIDPDSFNDFGPREPVAREALTRGPLRNEHNGMLIIERIADDAPIGTIGWRRVTVYGPSPGSDAWQIGIELIPEARGQGLGTEAQRLVADYLFATTDLHRVEASTDVDNAAEQRSLEKAGYTREGVMRRAQLRGGKYHDLAYYSRLRQEQPAGQPPMAEIAAASLTSTTRGRLPCEGRLVRLRDVTLADAEMLDTWSIEREPDSFNNLGQPHRPTPRDVLASGPLRDDRRGRLIVERLEDGAPIGSVSWHVVGYGPNAASHCFNIGIELLPWARGHGYGTDAQRLLADWLFSASDVNRVEASTDVDNLSEQRALEKAGYTREGVQRGAQFRAGRYHDMVTYSRIRSD